MTSPKVRCFPVRTRPASASASSAVRARSASLRDPSTTRLSRRRRPVTGSDPASTQIREPDPCAVIDRRMGSGVPPTSDSWHMDWHTGGGQ